MLSRGFALTKSQKIGINCWHLLALKFLWHFIYTKSLSKAASLFENILKFLLENLQLTLSGNSLSNYSNIQKSPQTWLRKVSSEGPVLNYAGGSKS